MQNTCIAQNSKDTQSTENLIFGTSLTLACIFCCLFISPKLRTISSLTPPIVFYQNQRLHRGYSQSEINLVGRAIWDRKPMSEKRAGCGRLFRREIQKGFLWKANKILIKKIYMSRWFEIIFLNLSHNICNSRWERVKVKDIDPLQHGAGKERFRLPYLPPVTHPSHFRGCGCYFEPHFHSALS